MTDQDLSFGWIQTYMGKPFWPLAPRVEDIDPLDIAHALSMLCRYGGHVDRFYSVAEHCYLMSYAVSEENALWALLHDATEAYMGDMVRPIKNLMPDYRVAEGRLMRVICEWAGLNPTEPEEVLKADTAILRDERAALMKMGGPKWHTLEDVPRLGVIVQGYPPEVAERLYLQRLREWTG